MSKSITKKNVRRREWGKIENQNQKIGENIIPPI